ncbi:MAG TPA: PEGA domain-containing protein [Terriglobia bacterium]|nr:PEGA domain-containing protein [Terriglobia bacterium]
MNAKPLAALLRSRRRLRVHGWGAIVVALLLGALLAGPVALGQKTEKLSLEDVVKLLKGFVQPDRVAVIAKNRGVNFRVTDDTEKLLREAGANDNLVSTLKDLAPKPTAPVLVVHSTPGHAQVYIDDVPIGTTSPEGLLKLPTLSPGDHKVRLSLESFSDYEVVAKLVPGETTTLDAKLAAAPSVPAKPATPPDKKAGGSNGAASVPKDKLKTFDGTVENRKSKFVLVVKETLRKKVYQVEPQSMFSSFADQRVRVTGSKNGDVITAQSVEPH